MSQTLNISLIIPTWNAAKTICAALDSALGQSCPPSEIIIVDDGSTDETAQVLAPYMERVHYRRQENAGPAAARNRALGLVTGDLIAFLDADDLIPPGALELMCNALRIDPGVEIVHGHIQDFVEQDGELLMGAPRLAANLGSALVRRRLFDTVGIFDESLLLGEDLDLWIRAREHGIRRQIVSDVTYWYRRRVVEPLGSAELHKATLARVMKRSLERSRRQTT